MIAKAVKFHCENGLGIVQFGTSGQNTFEYSTVAKVLGEKRMEVREMDEAGRVNTVLVLNRSDRYVFMMDGDILAGAKQNRVVNASVLLKPRSETGIPVSCVERGRWHAVSPRFVSTDYVAPTRLRASKASQVRNNLRANRGFGADQSEIWGSVDDYGKKYRVSSGTSNISDIFVEKQTHLDRLVGRCVPDPHANGVAVFFGKSLVGADIFNRTDVYLEYFPKILRGAAFDAESLRRPNSVLTQAEAEYRTLDMLDTIDQLPRDERPSVGAGVDRRFEWGSITGFELVYENHLIHLGVLERPAR